MIILNFKVCNRNKYKMKTILNDVVYRKELKIVYLLELYYYILFKDYLKEESN